MWREHAHAAHQCCSDKFWNLFEAVRSSSITSKNKVLSAVKKMLPASETGHGWPKSCRVLRKRVAMKAGNFWDNVTNTYHIDLTRFELPGCTRVSFSIIDPVYVWISCAVSLHKSGTPLHWHPQTMKHPDTGEALYGAGIQFGKLLRAASEAGQGKIAMFNINWDGGGTGFGSRSCVPIHVQVMNTNSSSTRGLGLVGYLPYIPVPEKCRQDTNYLAAKKHVLQTCIGKVLDCIEARAPHGFKCDIGGDTLLLLPRVGVMSLDTPERVKYFGLRNVSSCPICRKRQGRSLTRIATCHCPDEIKRLYTAANVEAHTMPRIRTRKRARERLNRHGLDYKKRCRLHDHAKVSLVPPIVSIGPRLFGGVARYERMHVYHINYCTYLMELLVKSVHKRHYATVCAVVTQCHQFRHPRSGATHPRLPNLLKMTHLTAERRVRAIFYWAHVLGVRADVILAPIRQVAQRAVATLQLILIAVRGHRAYTSGELDTIFTGVGTQFFRALEELSQFHNQLEYSNQTILHRRDPERHATPVVFRRARRFD